MRRSIFCLLIFFSSLSFSQEETTVEDKIDFGFRFGLSLSDLVTDDNTLTPRATFFVGAHAEYKINSTWSIQPELLYVRKGESARNTIQESNIRTENRLLLDYIELPIMVKYYFTQGLSFNLGPYASYLVAAEQENLIGNQLESSNIQQQIENIDAGMAIGANYATEWDFFIGIRYSQGFTSVFKKAFANFEDSYHAQFQMYLGYSF